MCDNNVVYTADPRTVRICQNVIPEAMSDTISYYNIQRINSLYFGTHSKHNCSRRMSDGHILPIPKYTASMKTKFYFLKKKKMTDILWYFYIFIFFFCFHSISAHNNYLYTKPPSLLVAAVWRFFSSTAQYTIYYILI